MNDHRDNLPRTSGAVSLRATSPSDTRGSDAAASAFRQARNLRALTAASIYALVALVMLHASVGFRPDADLDVETTTLATPPATAPGGRTDPRFLQAPASDPVPALPEIDRNATVDRPPIPAF